MNKTKIEWCDYTINPVKGLCPIACSYCYARAMYKRFKWNPEIRYILNETAGLYDIWRKGMTDKKHYKVFIGSTMELFGSHIQDEWMGHILKTVDGISQLDYAPTVIFLTKQPQNLIKWSPFPDNCWIGASATDSDRFAGVVNSLMNIQARVKFVSIEPLLAWPRLDISSWMRQIHWLIIGQQTPVSAKTQPKIEWVQKIVEAADKAGIPVFLKNNLEPLFNIGMMPHSCLDGASFLRQEVIK